MASIPLAQRSAKTQAESFSDFDTTFSTRLDEADQFYANIQRDLTDKDARLVQRTFDELVQAEHFALAAERDELDLARVARLEAHGGAGRDVQPHAVRRRAIEGEPAVHLEEMTVRSDLHRTIAAVADRDATRRAPRVQLDRIGCEKIFAGNHRAHRMGW